MAVDRTGGVEFRNPFLRREEVAAARLLHPDFAFTVRTLVFAAETQRILIAPRAAVVVIRNPEDDRRMVAVFADQISGHRFKTVGVLLYGQVAELPRMRQRNAVQVAGFIRGFEAAAQIIRFALREVVVAADREVEAELAQAPVRFKRALFRRLVGHPECAVIRQVVGAQVDDRAVQHVVLPGRCRIRGSRTVRGASHRRFPRRNAT